MPKVSKTNLLDFELMYDYVMVRALEVGASGGLAKPDQYDDKSEFGEVIKVGTGRLLDDGTIVPLRMKPGDIVYFGKYSSVSVRSEGVDYLIVRDDDIMAVRNEKSSKKVSG